MDFQFVFEIVISCCGVDCNGSALAGEGAGEFQLQLLQVFSSHYSLV